MFLHLRLCFAPAYYCKKNIQRQMASCDGLCSFWQPATEECSILIIPTEPWFDKECRDAKRATGRLERSSVLLPPSTLMMMTHAPPLLLPCSRLLLPRRRGTMNGVSIASCGSRGVLNSGRSTRTWTPAFKFCRNRRLVV